MIGVDNRRVCVLGDSESKLETEKFALAVNDVRSPFYQLIYERMMVCHGHPDVGINHFQRYGTDVVNVTVTITVHFIGQRENPHVMSFVLQYVIQITDGGDNTVGGGCIKIGRD